MKFDIKSAYLDETREFIAGLGEEPFRTGQVYGWAHKKYAAKFSDMTNLPLDLREKLENSAFLTRASIKDKKIARDGTIKYLNEFANHNIIDGNEDFGKEVCVESVLMDYRHGAAMCVSTQAGCAMGCAFCASGKGGLLRSLTAGEMLAQVHAAVLDSGKAVSNITLMGSGEPLDNYENTLRFIRLAAAQDSLGVSGRKITLSTIGLTDKILALAEEKLQITLAVSLHAPNDRVRAEFVPAARAYPIEGLLASCKKYGDVTKRRVTFEYAMVMGKNDRPDQAAELAARLKNMLCHVNLIPMNRIKNLEAGSEKRGFRPSGERSIEAFRDVLIKNGIETTVRRALGAGINAACGQLVGRGLAPAGTAD